MSAPSYAVLRLDLATARTAERIVEVGRPIDGITVQAIPVGALCQVSFGSNKDLVTLQDGQSFEICPVLDEGLFLTNPLAAGILELIISFGGIGVVSA